MASSRLKEVFRISCSVRSLLQGLLTACVLTGVLYYVGLPSTFIHPGPSSRLRQTITEIMDRSLKFTPDVLLEAPRRSSAIPNSAGTLALFTVSTYSFDGHGKTKEIKVFDIQARGSALISNDDKASEPAWLGNGNNILWLREGEKGSTQLFVGNARKLGDTYVAGTVPGPIENLKLHQLDNDTIAIAVSGKANPNGTLHNPELQPKKHSTGVIYDCPFVRHWDEYVTPARNAIWYGVLRLEAGRYTFSGLNNAMLDSNVTLESPIPTFGGADHFDISGSGIVFVAKDPLLNPSTNTKCNAYFVPILDFTSLLSPSMPRKIHIAGFEGAATSPVFSHDGKSLAFLQMRENGYESDKNRLLVVPDIFYPDNGFEAFTSDDGKGSWDRSPSAITWSMDDKQLYLQAEVKGRELLFGLNVPQEASSETSALPLLMTHQGSVSGVKTLGSSSSLLISSTSMIDNSIYSIISTEEPFQSRDISSNSQNGSSFSLSSEQISEIEFPGAVGTQNIHAWVIKPSNFSSDQKYPMAYLIHGGPQGAWTDSWSTRWNPAVFAEQGYVVVTPNPTGSTGYGQAFTDAIREQWGGPPYEDLVNGFEYIKSNLSYVDTDRAVALGASYGGYMMNWMQGHSLAKEFKALVCHDGVFSMANQLSSDEQYFPNHDLGGPYWQNGHVWEKWNPARHTENWSTPMLVIHNEKDYRLPISEGLAMFNVLQEKGVESRFLSFPDENHWVLKEENSLLWHTVVLNWINRFVRLPAYRDEQEIREYVMSRER